MRKIITALSLTFFLVACARNGQNNYNFNEVGQSTAVEFGKVVSSRVVHISGENTGVGAIGGAAAGASIARSGDDKGAIAGLLIGAIAGAIAEQQLANRQGVEYVIAMRNNMGESEYCKRHCEKDWHRVVKIVQEINEGEEVFKPGKRVIVETSGKYQRVLSAEALPSEISAAKGIKQIDDDEVPAKPVRKKSKTKSKPVQTDEIDSSDQ